ncbi:MAG TPA: UDP-N-acetylglucosamine 1-carboxyvinyltransferase [Candidatus Brocadiia bacterium]|nr:UDP-N-acetylglucosamine 1-carboxyvinyltransferase [Candidatus Brocadiia bacterium]
MDKFIIDGGKQLKGNVRINGSKNAALPIMAACLLTNDPIRIKSIPHLRDVESLRRILDELGCRSEWLDAKTLELHTRDETFSTAPYELVSTMRGSICVLGPLLGKRRQAKVSLPGGCVIGLRPIDLHIKGLKALDTQFRFRHGYLEGKAKQLSGAQIYLGGHFGSTVLGTANVMCAAVLAKGVTIIDDAACEPEIQDLANFLVACGAKIDGIGGKQLVITGVKALHGCEYEIIPDRIEAGTFMAAAALTKGNVLLENVKAEHMGAVLDKMREMGVKFQFTNGSKCRVTCRQLKPADVTTLPYPGVPTDMQAQLMVMAAVAQGMSVITERIFPDRFMHAAELNRMGANIRLEGASAIVQGVETLTGAPVIASDLRASAALVLAGLVAEKTTEVQRVYHIDRGYEHIEEKLKKLGASIHRITE